MPGGPPVSVAAFDLLQFDQTLKPGMPANAGANYAH